MKDDLLTELAALGTDLDDSVTLTTSAEVGEASRMPNGVEKVNRLEQLAERYPDSGNVCMLYAQALWVSGRVADAASFIGARLSAVKCKSQPASLLGQMYLFQDDYRQATAWFIRTAAPAAGNRGRLEFISPYLAGLYSAAALITGQAELESAARWFARLSDLGLDDDTKKKILQMARTQCDAATASLMREASRRFGWR